MSDEEYLITQVLSSQKADVYAAKSWMIFSKSVFPQSFPVLFQCYKMECEEKNLTESAVCLSDLIKKFPNEITLIKELRLISNALCNDNSEFLKKIFEELSEDIKYEVMLIVTRDAQTIEEHCKLMLLFLKRMPNARLLQHGSNIIDTLLKAEDKSSIYLPINLFRKMLVCDALPLILKVSQFEYKFKIIFQLLQKAVEFYVCCIFTYSTNHDFAIRKEIVPPDNNPDEYWKLLLKLFETVALRYRWSYPEMFVSNFNELSLQQLLSLLKRKNKLLQSLTNEKHRREETMGFEEAYFCLVITFFYYLHTFGKHMHPKIFANNVTGPYNYVLMEGISFPPDDCPKQMPSDFKATDRGYLVISKSGAPEATSLLIPSFTTAVECWELLHRHQHLMKEFNCLCSNIKLESWTVFQEFYIDSLIYGTRHRDAIDHLGRIRESSIDITHKNKAALQMASCYHLVRDYEHALKIIFDVVMNLPVVSKTPVKNSVGKCSLRFIHFMGYNNSEILQYCVSLLLKLYKCKDKFDDTYKDIALGHILVLIQYNLDQEYEMLQKCIDAIKKAKTFSFPKFFNYIINIDVLEEISYLATPAGGNVNLEILSTPTFQASKQRAVTRGVNKGARDDLKLAFVNQMAHCYDNLDNLFIEFIKEEQNILLLPLSE